MSLQVDKVGIPVLAALMIIGFLFWWPAGLFFLAFLVWTGIAAKRVFGFSIPKMPQLFGSGNAAFDEHRAEVIAALKKEEGDFGDFIAELNKAKDRAEFDQFMAKRQPQ